MRWSALTGSWHDCTMSVYIIKLNGSYCSSVAETKGTHRDNCALNCEKCSSLSHVRLCNSMNCYKPGSSVHRILKARILEWVAVPFTRGSSWPRDRTQVSRIVGRFFTVWGTREAQLPISYLFHTCWCKTVLLSTHRTLPFPHCVHVCSLRLHLYSCPGNGSSSTSFLDSKYMC